MSGSCASALPLRRSPVWAFGDGLPQADREVYADSGMQMSVAHSTSESQNRALHAHRGRARSIVHGVAMSLLAVFGGLVLIGMTVFTLRLDILGRIAADQILANAIRPSGREMPATSGAIPYASADIQIVDGMGLGISCSLPPMLEGLAFPTRNVASPIGRRMRRACFVRISRGQILIADLGADGLTDVTLPQGSGSDAPLRICSLTPRGTCIAFDRSDGGIMLCRSTY